MSDRQTDRLVRALGGIGEDLIAKAAPEYREIRLPAEVHRMAFEDKTELPDKTEVCRWRIKRAAAGLAAAAVVIAGGALLWVNRETIFTQGNEGAGQGTAALGVTTSASAGGAATLPEPELTETSPVEYTYPKDNVFVYENTLYEIDARAAFDYAVKTDGGYTSIFVKDDPMYESEYYTDPVRDCLKDEYRVGDLNIVSGMPVKSRETNFRKPAELYSYDPPDGREYPSDSSQKYVVAQVSGEELELIRNYFSDSLAVPFEDIDTGSLRGIYYVTAQTTIMPADYYDFISRESAVETARTALRAEGMDDYFRTGSNYVAFPLPVFAAPTVSSLDENMRLGEVTFYIGGGTQVYAAIVDNKVDESWNIEPISEAYVKGEKVMFVGDSNGTVVMFTSSGGQYLVRGRDIWNGAELVEKHLFPIRRAAVMDPPPSDYELTDADLDDIYEKAYTAWGNYADHASLGYPINADYRVSDSLGTWYIPLFSGDRIVGMITAFRVNGEWYAGQFGEAVPARFTELYESGTPFNLTGFGDVLYICTPDAKSEPFENYGTPANVYLYAPEKAAPVRKWNKADNEKS